MPRGLGGGMNTKMGGRPTGGRPGTGPNWNGHDVPQRA